MPLLFFIIFLHADAAFFSLPLKIYRCCFADIRHAAAAIFLVCRRFSLSPYVYALFAELPLMPLRIDDAVDV